MPLTKGEEVRYVTAGNASYPSETVDARVTGVNKDGTVGIEIEFDGTRFDAVPVFDPGKGPAGGGYVEAPKPDPLGGQKSATPVPQTVVVPPKK